MESLWKKFIKDRRNIEIRNRIVEQYLWIVPIHANQIMRRLPATVRFDEMVSAGVLGLLDAVQNYNPAKGVKFESFCVLRVRGAMLFSTSSGIHRLGIARYRQKIILGRSVAGRRSAACQSQSKTPHDRQAYRSHGIIGPMRQAGRYNF